MKQTKKQKKIAFFKLKIKIISLIYIFFFTYLFFPMPTLADEAVRQSKVDFIMSQVEEIENNRVKPKIVNYLPENETKEAELGGFRVITAYNSEVGQCDDTPCETANLFNVCEFGIENTVAANFLPLGTTIKIPELFGDRVFVVRDRMNRRYTDRIDVWMKDKAEAKIFGVKYAKIEILR